MSSNRGPFGLKRGRLMRQGIRSTWSPESPLATVSTVDPRRVLRDTFGFDGVLCSIVPVHEVA